MFRRIKMELQVLRDNISAVIASAFICAFGGVLVWVNGGSTWYVVRNVSNPAMTLPLSLVFTVWLITYGLIGVEAWLVWVSFQCKLCRQQCGLISLSLVMLTYLLAILWYAVFFCTRLYILGVLLLIISFAVQFAVFLLMRRTLWLMTAVVFLVESVLINFIFSSV